MLLLDEVDTRVGDTLLSMLRQLRAGYDFRQLGVRVFDPFDTDSRDGTPSA